MADAVKELCELVLARSADAELLKLASALLSEIEDEEGDGGSIADEMDDSMDGDSETALASAGFGVDESYGGPGPDDERD